MTLDDFVANMVQLGRRLGRQRLDPGPLIAIGRRLVADRTRALDAFVASVANDPDRLRVRWLGETSLRRHRLDALGRRALDVIGLSPDLLEPARRRHDERLHTETIAWAMGPRGPDPAAAKLAFVNAVRRAKRHGGAEQFDDLGLDLDNMSAASEMVLDGFGRVDVWLESRTHVIAVEAKVLAKEGADQIPRYNRAKAVFGRGRIWTVVFLTADETAEPSGSALRLNFRDLLAAWLPVAVGGDTGRHRHLAAYLASVARVCDVARPGDFDDWTFVQRRQALDIASGGST